jgi:hypothetical protein
MELGCQNFCSLLRAELITVLDALESHTARGEMLSDALNSSPPLIGQASLRVFSLRLGRSMLDEINCHSPSPPRAADPKARLTKEKTIFSQLRAKITEFARLAGVVTGLA